MNRTIIVPVDPDCWRPKLVFLMADGLRCRGIELRVRQPFHRRIHVLDNDGPILVEISDQYESIGEHSGARSGSSIPKLVGIVAKRLTHYRQVH